MLNHNNYSLMGNFITLTNKTFNYECKKLFYRRNSRWYR